MVEKQADIVIVGAGAAGLMSAIWAGRIAETSGVSLKILLLDTRHKTGAKILMSGGTRCNVTNREVKPSDFEGGPRHFIKHVLQMFTPQKTIQFFKTIGVELTQEPTGKYFPVTHSAETVLDALAKEARRVGVVLKTGTRVVGIRKKEKQFYLKIQNSTSQITAQKIILTTGGLSYPTTGSDGKGMDISKTLGHTITKTFPALTPLLTDDTDWKGLSGISLKAKLSFFKNGKKTCETHDSFLFTHFGFSGPAALDLSRHFASAQNEDKPQIIANFLPSHDEQTFKNLLRSLQIKHPNKYIKNILIEAGGLPHRFVKVLMKKCALNETVTTGGCSKENRRQLFRNLFHCPLEVKRVFGYQKAEVTAGGVVLKEVSVSTMESKRVEGLYFAGEILDVDGRIGGFNFQWAWSTGAVAGQSAARSLTK